MRMTEKRRKHVNIPIFVVHMGCPNQCVFCDQRLISGTSSFSEETVRGKIEEVLATVPPNAEVEIAFFGGSFTGIDRDLMIRLLDTAEEYVKAGKVQGIRLSTRPDYISEEILESLSRYTVREVELGVQSISDTVLTASKRGHTAADTYRAFDLLRAAGIPFGGQMMIGLPSATVESEIRTAEEICAAGASSCRVYPTAVFHGTELAEMTERGEYLPLTLTDAVERMWRVLDVFDRHGVVCLRAGLCESDNMHDTDTFLAGVNHPAVGELARSALMAERIEENLSSLSESLCGSSIVIEVAKGAASLAAGQHRANTLRFLERYGIKNLKILEKDGIIGYNNIISILSP